MPDVEVVTGPNVVLDVNVVSSPSGTGGGDHGALSGLTDDDHSQYALADGSRGTFEVAGAVATHSADTTAVHGIANTANLVLTSDSRLSDARTPTAHASSHHIGGSDVLAASSLAYSPSEPGDWAITPNDIGEALDTLVATIPAGYSDEQVRDVVGTALVGGTNITVTPNDGADTITIASSTGANDRAISLLVTDPNGSAITTGDGKAYFTVPALFNTWNIISVHAALTTVSSSGTPTVQLARTRSGSTVDVLSTAVTIDANELTSYTAATAHVVNTSNDDLATGDLLRVDVDAAGTGAKGLQAIITVRQ